MSSLLPPLTSSPAEAPAPTRPPLPWREWLREPLLHFLAAGALLFALDHAINRGEDEARTIVIGPQVEQEARETFRATRGHEPTDEEMRALHQVWLDNEVLYREGLALQLDRGDTAIRERVIFKALNVIDAGTKLPPADEATLRAWFEAHRAKYDEPARFDFQEAVLSGDSSEAAVRAFVAALNAGTPPADAQAGLRVFKSRPLANLVQSYGQDFAQALQSATPGRWQAIKSASGWRAVHLDAQSAARPGNFEALRGIVLQDWTDQTASEQRSAAVRTLTRKYRIVHEGKPS